MIKDVTFDVSPRNFCLIFSTTMRGCGQKGIFLYHPLQLKESRLY